MQLWMSMGTFLVFTDNEIASDNENSAVPGSRNVAVTITNWAIID